jgi:hypothetical protein
MDHDKQVTDLVQGTRDRFLNQPLRPDDRDAAFDLDKEFAKSAKNRSLLIPAAVALFLAFLGVGAWIASQFTEQASQKSTVSIGSFEDLKLKEIFDTARRNKKDLEDVQSQMDQLTQVSAARVAVLQQAGASKADIASVNDASGNQAKAILAETNRKIADERASLATALKPLKAQAESIQKKIDTYDDRIGQLNKKNQQVLDSQQRLFDLEKQKITDEYDARLQSQTNQAAATVARLKKERDDLVSALKARQAEEIRKLILKYNPVIADPVVAAQLTAYGTQAAAYPGLTLPERIAAKNLLSADLQSTLAGRVERTRKLLAVLQAIPYENSVPPLLNTLDNAIADSLAGYDGYLVPLAAALSDQDAVIARQEAAIADRDAKITELTQAVAQARADLQAELADRKAAEAVAADDKKADEASRAADRAAVLASASRWKNGVEAFAALVKEDGIVVDPKAADDVFVVLKADRAKALTAALSLSPAVNTATVHDAANNADLGTVTLEAVDGGWRAKTVKLADPRKPFKAFDRVVLSASIKK